MPSGLPLESTLILRRGQGKHILELRRRGPFIECYLGEILIGKVRGKQIVLSPAGCDIEECIRLPHYTILLSDIECVEITAAMITKTTAEADKELRAQCPYAGTTAQDEWIAKVKAGEIKAGDF